MVKSAENRPSNEPLYRPTARRIVVQGEVSSAFVVIAGVGRSDPAQMPLAEDNGMIEALPADRADQSLRMPVIGYVSGGAPLLKLGIELAQSTVAKYMAKRRPGGSGQTWK